MDKEKYHIEQNQRREILLETSLPYSVFTLSLFCFSFFLLLDVSVVPVTQKLRQPSKNLFFLKKMSFIVYEYHLQVEAVKIGNIIEKVNEYDQELPQSQTADKPMTPRGRATQQSRDAKKTKTK